MKIRMRRMILPAMVAALAIGVIPCAAQDMPVPPRAPRAPRPPRAPRSWSEANGQGVARIDTVFAFSTNGTIDLSLVSGSMKLSTWDRPEVHVVASTTGEPSLEFDASNSHVKIGRAHV